MGKMRNSETYPNDGERYSQVIGAGDGHRQVDMIVKRSSIFGPNSDYPLPRSAEGLFDALSALARLSREEVRQAIKESVLVASHEMDGTVIPESELREIADQEEEAYYKAWALLGTMVGIQLPYVWTDKGRSVVEYDFDEDHPDMDALSTVLYEHDGVKLVKACWDGETD